MLRHPCPSLLCVPQPPGIFLPPNGNDLPLPCSFPRPESGVSLAAQGGRSTPGLLRPPAAPPPGGVAVPRVRCPRAGAGDSTAWLPPAPPKPIPRGSAAPRAQPGPARSQPGPAGVAHRAPSPRCPGPSPALSRLTSPPCPAPAAGWSPQLACASPSASPASSRPRVSRGARGTRIPPRERGRPRCPGQRRSARRESRGRALGWR